jgi:hypothetical protein
VTALADQLRWLIGALHDTLRSGRGAAGPGDVRSRDPVRPVPCRRRLIGGCRPARQPCPARAAGAPAGEGGR